MDFTIRCAGEGAVHGAALAMQPVSVAPRSEQEGGSDEKSQPGLLVAVSEGASGAMAELTFPLVAGALETFHLFVVAEGRRTDRAELALENRAIGTTLPRREDGHEATFRADFATDAVRMKQL